LPTPALVVIGEVVALRAALAADTECELTAAAS
jgi:hypothetical protein